MQASEAPMFRSFGRSNLLELQVGYLPQRWQSYPTWQQPKIVLTVQHLYEQTAELYGAGNGDRHFGE